jgi:hypothetical protein
VGRHHHELAWHRGTGKDDLLARVLHTHKDAVRKEEEKPRRKDPVGDFNAMLQAYDEDKAKRSAPQGTEGNVAARTAEIAARLDSARAPQPSK